MKKYNNGSEDPLYWKLCLGLGGYGILSYWVDPIFSIGALFSLMGVIIYVLIFKDSRVRKTKPKKEVQE